MIDILLDETYMAKSFGVLEARMLERGGYPIKQQWEERKILNYG